MKKKMLLISVVFAREKGVWSEKKTSKHWQVTILLHYRTNWSHYLSVLGSWLCWDNSKSFFSIFSFSTVILSNCFQVLMLLIPRLLLGVFLCFLLFINMVYHLFLQMHAMVIGEMLGKKIRKKKKMLKIQLSFCYPKMMISKILANSLLF